MDKERSVYAVSLEKDPDQTYVMALTKDQVKVFKWLEKQGYDFSIVEQGDTPIIL